MECLLASIDLLPLSCVKSGYLLTVVIKSDFNLAVKRISYEKSTQETDSGTRIDADSEWAQIAPLAPVRLSIRSKLQQCV
jgi:hypothetical protein